MNAKELRAALRTVRTTMKAEGIRRSSCFNGGHSARSYALNAELFRLATLLKAEQRKEQAGAGRSVGGLSPATEREITDAEPVEWATDNENEAE